MDAFIQLSQRDQSLFCEQAAAKLGLPAASIEKDFWVCWTLRELFSLPNWSEHLTFKGGTSLSKAWKLIERFSEDIDVVIHRDFLGFSGELSSNRLRKLKAKSCEAIQLQLLPKLHAHFQKLMPKNASWDLSVASAEEDPDGQTLLFTYPGVFHQSVSYLRPLVKIEMGARSDTEPSERVVLRSYLTEAYPTQLPGEFTISVVAARRTFWEKAMLLHEETYRPEDKPRKRSLARHYYDLYSLITKGVADQAVNDHDLFERIASHREIFFGWTWMDYATLRRGSLRLQPLADQLPQWHSDYNAMKREMFYGEVPTFDQVLEVVAEFEEKFNRA
jgi:predicted nucleotidyltransferase component of viral defense system